MISTASAIDFWSATEISHDRHERLVEHAAIRQISDQSAECLVQSWDQRMRCRARMTWNTVCVGGKIQVVVPAGVIHGDKGDAALDQSAGKEALLADVVAA